MKTLLLLTTFLLLSLTSFAQDPTWLEVGSEWTYQHGHCCGPEYFQLKFGITEFATHLGKACAQMDHISGWGNGCMSLQPPFYFYHSNDSLYFSNNDLDEFRLAVDFGAEPGDSWEYILGYGADISSYTLVVNTVTTVEVDGYSLRQLNVTYNYNGEEGMMNYFIEPETIDITEVVGAHYTFFVPMGHGSICHGATNITVQCFESPSLSYINPLYPACDFITSIEAMEAKQEMHIFPNPANSWVRIDGQAAAQVNRVEVYNLSGQLIGTHTAHQMNNLTIDVSALPPGMYLIHAHGASGLRVAKIVKE